MTVSQGLIQVNSACSRNNAGQGIVKRTILAFFDPQDVGGGGKRQQVGAVRVCSRLATASARVSRATRSSSRLDRGLSRRTRRSIRHSERIGPKLDDKTFHDELEHRLHGRLIGTGGGQQLPQMHP